MGGSGIRHRRGGRILVGVILTFIFGFPILTTLITGKPGGMFFAGVIGPLFAWWTQRQPRGRLFRAITRALEQIAEANPTPDVREVIPELEVLASDALQQDRETRTALREASRRIDTLTDNLRSLPIAATAPGPDVATLPTPAAPRTSDPEALPRAVS